MHGSIPVEEVMVADVVTATPETSVAETARRLREHGVSSVVVVEGAVPVGIVTEGDFVSNLYQYSDFGRRDVGEVMSTPLETLSPEETIVEAAERLHALEIEHLPVVGGGKERSEDESGKESSPAGRLVGIVTAPDLSYYIPQLLRPPAGRVREGEPPRRTVRSDTAYERDEWAFSYHGEYPDRVDVGDVAVFEKPVTTEDLEAFAEATGDTNRVHLDAEYAAGTRFGQRIVHGVLSLGLVSAALARLPGLTIYLSQECSFQAPITVGDRVRARCEIIEELGGSKYRVETTVFDGDGTRVLGGEAVVLVDELPPEAASEGESTT